MRAKVKRTKSAPPSLVEENGLSAEGYRLIAGVDEAGRGALAGPVVAAAVILPLSPVFRWLESVRDSKELPAAKREFLFDFIKQDAIAVSVGIIAPQTIDVIGILNATKIAMCYAVEQLATPPDFLLIDFLRLTILLFFFKDFFLRFKAFFMIFFFFIPMPCSPLRAPYIP